MGLSRDSARTDLIARVHGTVRHLDDRQFGAFLNDLAPDGEYRIEVKAPEVQDTMIWMQMTRDELKKRFDSMPRHEWQAALPERSTLVAVDDIRIDADDAHTSSTFAIYHTDTGGRSACYAVGRYEDDWRCLDGVWKIAKRKVILKTRLLTIPSPVPI